jgi:hypothetical protein
MKDYRLFFEPDSPVPQSTHLRFEEIAARSHTRAMFPLDHPQRQS